MAEEVPGGSGAVGGTTLVIPGEMAARVDSLPVSRMAWELALLVQVGWACAASADGISARLYPFIWLPRHIMTSFEYSVLYALETGISILIGGYAIGWLADRIGRRKALILSSVLAGAFIWPFGYVTRKPGAGCPLDRRHSRVRRVPGRQRRLHERDHGAGGPEQGDHARAGARHRPARCRPSQPHPALLDPW
jgi:hypothetical protein